MADGLSSVECCPRLEKDLLRADFLTLGWRQSLVFSWFPESDKLAWGWGATVVDPRWELHTRFPR
jgi:hypothetical protein